MPTVSRVTTPPTTVSQATPTAGVTAPAATQAPAASELVGNPNATGVAADAPRTAAGLPEGYDAAKLALCGALGAKEGITGSYIARPSSSTFAAYGDITAVRPTLDGFTVDVQLYAQKATDKVALALQLPLLDTETKALTLLNLDLLTFDPAAKTFSDTITTAEGSDPISKATCFTGRRTYTFSLKQLQSYLDSLGLGVTLRPGDQLNISGFIEGDGHRIMNGVSNTFAIPEPLAATPTSPAAVQMAQLSGDPVAKARDLPLDITVKLPSSLLKETIGVYTTDPTTGRATYTNLKIGDVIAGDITTRLESEYKGSVSREQLDTMLTAAYELVALSEKAEAGDAAAQKTLARRLGKDRVLRPVRRHWMCTDGKPLGDRDPATVTIKRDAAGRPEIDPMRDTYSDNKTLDISKVSGGVRVRTNGQKQGHAEFKLSGGVLDPKTGIRQRVEIGLSLAPNATEEQLRSLLAQARSYQTSTLNQSSFGVLVAEADKAGIASALVTDRTAWAEVTQIRHKFELKNTVTGTSEEISLDEVHAKTTRPEHMVDGKPQEAVYYVVETELDHLQINSANVIETPDVKEKTALLTQADQDKWVGKKKERLAEGKTGLVSLKKPQLHTLEHLTEGSFRKTASYREFEDMQKRVLKALCGDFKPGPARQKAAHFAELLELVPAEIPVLVKRP